jgi:hypothetical protein
MEKHLEQGNEMNSKQYASLQKKVTHHAYQDAVLNGVSSFEGDDEIGMIKATFVGNEYRVECWMKPTSVNNVEAWVKDDDGMWRTK